MALHTALAGTVSLISLSILSYERYVRVLRRHMKVNVSSYQKSCLFIAGSWFYSLLWTLPPLFGWSSYGPEGPGTTCSVAWHSRSPNNISYIICLFIFCLILPLLTMIYCYGKIMRAIKMQVSRFNMTTVQKRERHILFMVVSMVTCYLLCWMPYGIVSLIATFGKPITPTVSIVPSILAKTSTFVNPVLYVLLNKQFYRCFIALIKCGPFPRHTENILNSKESQNFETAGQLHNSTGGSNSESAREDSAAAGI
ncbi:pinopsin-like [Macrochelys suwanniensis]